MPWRGGDEVREQRGRWEERGGEQRRREERRGEERRGGEERGGVISANFGMQAQLE